MKREVFDTLRELKEYIHKTPSLSQRKRPYKVVIDGVEKFTLGGNSDSAIAAVTRSESDVEVESVGMEQLLSI